MQSVDRLIAKCNDVDHKQPIKLVSANKSLSPHIALLDNIVSSLRLGLVIEEAKNYQMTFGCDWRELGRISLHKDLLGRERPVACYLPWHLNICLEPRAPEESPPGILGLPNNIYV